MPEAIFLPGLRILVPERAQWNGGVLQGQRVIPIFTDGCKLRGGTDAGVFCWKLGRELHFRVNDDCSVFQAEIFAILKSIDVVAGGPTSDSESYMIFVESSCPLRRSGAIHGSFASARSR